MPTLEEAKLILSPFLENNPTSELKEVDGDEDLFVISRPWNEKGMVLILNITQNSEQIDRINEIILPERLSAVLNVTTQELEIIWTAYKLPGYQADIPGRKFEFEYEEVSHQCEFRPSSEVVKNLGQMMAQFAPSDTGFRNLTAYQQLSHSDGDGDRFGETCSFYISNISQIDESAIQLIRHLNFYLNYYDEFSPYVMIHAPNLEDDELENHRYIDGAFPSKIASSEISPDLLQFWTASRSNDKSQRFLFAYRIIENISTRFIDEKSLKGVKQLLKSPSALSNLEKLSGEIVSVLAASKMYDNQKIEAMVKSCVTPDAIWPFVEKYKDALCKPTCFDGGFQCDPLFSENVDLEYFRTNGVSNIVHRAREIRNALSHGNDSKTTLFITPTKRNDRLLKPWSDLLTRIAAEVLIYNQT